MPKKTKTSARPVSVKPKRRLLFRHPRPENPLSFKAGWRLGKETLLLFKSHPKLFGSLGIIYAAANVALVGGITQGSFLTLKDSLAQASGNAALKFGSLFAATASGSFSQPPGDLQQFLSGLLVAVFWLIIIWAVRFVLAKKDIKIRDALYQGPVSLIPFFAVLLVLSLQLLPAAVGIFALAVASANGLIVNYVELYAFVAGALVLTVISGYLVSGSVLSVVVVAPPGTYPLQALRVARRLTAGQRFRFIITLLWMLGWLLAVSIALLLPLLLIDSALNNDNVPLIPVAVEILGAFYLLFSATFVYKLYRELL